MRIFRFSPGITAAALVSFFTMTGAAFAQPKDGGFGHFWLYLEGFSPLDAKVDLGISSGDLDVSSELDFLTELLLDSEVDRGRVRGGFRLSRRHEIEFSALQIRRTNLQQLSQDFPIGDTVVSAGLDLLSVIETTDLEIGYNFYFLQRPNGEIGLATGIHGLIASYEAAASGQVEAGPLQESFTAVDDDEVKVPVPFLGLQAKGQLTRKLWLSGLVKLFNATVGDYDGSWTTFEALLEHRTFKHLGFGIGYYFNDVDVRQGGTLSAGSISDVVIENSGIGGFLRLEI